jgi:hypothetical protein
MIAISNTRARQRPRRRRRRDRTQWSPGDQGLADRPTTRWLRARLLRAGDQNHWTTTTFSPADPAELILLVDAWLQEFLRPSPRLLLSHSVTVA